MKFKRHIELEHGFKYIEIAPLIDMVFLLLIFFLLTSSFVIQSGIKVNLPKTVTSEIIRPKTIELVISAENIVYSGGSVITLEQLSDLLKRSSGLEQHVLIKSDKEASLGKVVRILDMCRDFGVAQINIATNQD